MYKSKLHNERFQVLLKFDHTEENDQHRKAFFYLMASSDQLFDVVKYTYNFKTSRDIVPSALNELALTQESKLMLEFSFHLVSDSYESLGARSLLTIFDSVDIENKKLSINALKIRFNIV